MANFYVNCRTDMQKIKVTKSGQNSEHQKCFQVSLSNGFILLRLEEIQFGFKGCNFSIVVRTIYPSLSRNGTLSLEMKCFDIFSLIVLTHVRPLHKFFPFISYQSCQKNSESWKTHVRESPFFSILHIFRWAVVNISSTAHHSTERGKQKSVSYEKETSIFFLFQSVSFCSWFYLPNSERKTHV